MIRSEGANIIILKDEVLVVIRFKVDFLGYFCVMYSYFAVMVY